MDQNHRPAIVLDDDVLAAVARDLRRGFGEHDGTTFPTWLPLSGNGSAT